MVFDWAAILNFMVNLANKSNLIKVCITILLIPCLTQIDWIANYFNPICSHNYFCLNLFTFCLSFILVEVSYIIWRYINNKLTAKHKEKQLRLHAIKIYENLNAEERQVVDNAILNNTVHYENSFDSIESQVILSLAIKGLGSRPHPSLLVFNKLFDKLRELKGEEIKRKYSKQKRNAYRIFTFLTFILSSLLRHTAVRNKFS